MSPTRTAGLTILAALSIVDLAVPLMTDGDNPPMAVALVGAAIGLASLVLLGYAARGAARAIPPLLGLRALSALVTVPAFFVGDVPAGARALAGGIVALTVVGIALVVAPARPVGVR